MRYQDLLKEKIRHLRTDDGETIRIYQNPDRLQLDAALKTGEVFGLLSGDGHLFIWPASLGGHNEMAERLGIHKVHCIDLRMDHNGPILSRAISADYRARAADVLAQSAAIRNLYGRSVAIR